MSSLYLHIIAFSGYWFDLFDIFTCSTVKVYHINVRLQNFIYKGLIDIEKCAANNNNANVLPSEWLLTASYLYLGRMMKRLEMKGIVQLKAVTHETGEWIHSHLITKYELSFFRSSCFQ